MPQIYDLAAIGGACRRCSKAEAVWCELRTSRSKRSDAARMKKEDGEGVRWVVEIDVDGVRFRRLTHWLRSQCLRLIRAASVSAASPFRPARLTHPTPARRSSSALPVAAARRSPGQQHASNHELAVPSRAAVRSLPPPLGRPAVSGSAVVMLECARCEPAPAAALAFTVRRPGATNPASNCSKAAGYGAMAPPRDRLPRWESPRMTLIPR